MKALQAIRCTTLAAALFVVSATKLVAGPDELVGMERSFAAAVAAEGARAAFLRFLAEDSVDFRPRPTQGLDHIRQQPDDPGLLEWAPAYARIARSGDLGFTLGPFRYRASRTNDAVASTGFYFTVWTRTPGGWRALLDGGVGSPPAEFPTEVETDGRDDADESLPAWERDQRHRDLRYTDESFARRAARDGEAAALDEYGHKRVRILRSGIGPISGRGDVTRFLEAGRRRTRDSIARVMVSGAGDLGIAWGESEAIAGEPGPPQSVRSWARVWRRSGWSGAWRVALDVAIDYPPASVERR